MPAEEVVFVIAEPGSPAPTWVIGGLTVLERTLREAERRGVARALVACAGSWPDGLGIAVTRVSPDTEPPDGATVVRADEVAGVRLTSEAARRAAEWKHLQSLPKSFQGPVDALINRHVSLRITRRLARTPITPNQVTIAAIAVGLVGAALVAFAGRTGVVAGGLLIAFQSILDSCDGELARLRFQFSRLGQWLDNIADDVTDTAFMAALGAAAGGTWLWIGLAAAAGRVFTQLALYWHVVKVGGDFYRFRWWFERGAGTMDEVYDVRSPMTWLRALGRRDVYCLREGVSFLTSVTRLRVPTN
jgi:phosphatidylglycerophosphate synthase